MYPFISVNNNNKKKTKYSVGKIILRDRAKQNSKVGEAIFSSF